ncbi:30199_t:CDS:2, partial [Gigaspora margarita]
LTDIIRKDRRNIWKQAAMAYADDTRWITNNKTKLSVEVGENKSIMQRKNADQAVRFLEVWLIEKGKKGHVNKIIQREIEALVQ